MKTYRVAVIGLGNMGGHHAQAVQAEHNCQLVAGADIQAEKKNSLGKTV